MEKKELNDEQVEKVTGGRGIRQYDPSGREQRQKVRPADPATDNAQVAGVQTAEPVTRVK